MRLLGLLCLFLPVIGWGQTPSSSEQVLSLDKFDSCGFVSRFAPNKIAKECFQSLDNAVLDQDYSILRRNGYAKYNATPCQGVKSVRGMWPFYATDGSQYLIVQSSSSMFYSKGDGTCNVITGLNNNLSPTAQMSCVQGLGNLWCTDGTDTVFNTNAVSTNAISAAPEGKYIGFYRNRIVISGVSGDLTSVYLSGELNGSDWTIPGIAYSTSPAIIKINGVNDGLGVKCLLGEFQNNYYIGRDYDLWALSGYDLRDFALRKVDSQIGCMDSNSPELVNNQLIWLSHRGIEGLGGTQINWLSYPIDPTLRTIIQAAGNSQAQVFTTQADWQTGNLTASGSGAPMSATISPGDVVPSSWSVTVPISSSSWVQSDFDTSTVSSESYDDFSSGNLNKWTQSQGTWGTLSVGSSTGMVPNSFSSGQASIYLPDGVSTGTWSFVFQSTNTSQSPEIFFNPYCASTQEPDCINTGLGKFIAVILSGNDLNWQYGTGTPGVFFSEFHTGATRISDGLSHRFLISLSTGNYFSVSYDAKVIVSSQIPTAYQFNSNSRTSLTSFSPNGFFVSDVRLPQFYETQMSVPYDTGFSTPTQGPILISISSSSVNPVQFIAQVSSSATGQWSASVSATSTSTISANPSKEFIRYGMRYSAPSQSPIPGGSSPSVSLVEETTGYWISPCITSVGNTSWGQLVVDAVTNGGSFTFAMSTSGVSCAQVIDPAKANWTNVTANSIISVPVSSYTAVRVLFGLSVATQVPTLNDLTVNWNAGASRPPVASAAYQNKYFLFYTTSSATTAANDHAVVYDQNGHFQLMDDINAASAALYLNSLYLGDSQATGTVYLFDTGSDDNGNPFNFSFQTPDLDGGDPVMLKSFSRAYLMLQAPTVTTAGQSLSCNYQLDGSTDTYSLGSVSLSEAAEQSGYFIAKMPFPVGQPNTGHWVNLSCSNAGSNGPIRIYGIRVVYTNNSWP